MKRFSLFALSLGAFGFANAATFSLSDGNAQVSGSDLSGLDSWFTDGTNNLFNQDYLFRLGNTGAEAVVGSTGPGTITTISANIVNVAHTMAGLFRVDITYTLIGGAAGSGTSDIGEVVRIQNLTNGVLDFHLFEYDDFDILGTFGGDRAGYNSGIISQWEGPVTSMVGTVPLANAYQIDTQANLVNSMFDGATTNFNNTTTANQPNDLAFGFQWDRTINAGGTFVMSKNKRIETVPEPATLAALGLGLAAIARRRRSK